MEQCSDVMNGEISLDLGNKICQVMSKNVFFFNKSVIIRRFKNTMELWQKNHYDSIDN